MRFNRHRFLNAMGLGLISFFWMGPVQVMSGDAAPSGVKRTSEKTVAAHVEIQKAVDAWAAEEKALLEKIDRTERSLKRVEWEKKKTGEYLATLEQKIAQLNEKAEEMKKINQELLPILDKGLEKLTAFVQGDVPFEKTRRLEQVEDAAQILNDYDAGLLLKTQTLFDAVAREVDVGHSVQTRETEIQVEGRSTRVKVLKVGRVGLYALSMDAKKAYVWDPEEKDYLPAEAGIREIDEAIQIAEGIRIIELTRLPVKKPTAPAQTGDGSHD